MAFTINIGAQAPDFHLPATDGSEYNLASFQDARLLIVAFTCNHCPYVIGSEGRIKQLVNDYADRRVRLVAINSNETENHPDDNFEHMITHARDQQLNFPYLRDERQDVAKSFGAIKTPQFFLLDENRKVRYIGRMDNNPKDESKATTRELRDALEDLLAGRDVSVPLTEPIGCTVKWWGKDRKFIPNDVCDLIL